MEILRCRGICKKFGGVQALSKVSMGFPEGEITGIIGTNGAGKTTLFNLLSGFLKPDGGKVELKMGRGWLDVTGKPPHRLAKLGLCRTFQATRLFEEYTLLENISLMERKRGEGAALLAMAKLADSGGKLPKGLSCYEARVAELLRAVAAGAALLFLDEPAAGMNREETEEFARILQLLRRERGLSVVLIEHDMALIGALCGKVYVMDGGKVAAKGGFEQVMGQKSVRLLLIGEEARA